MSMNLLPALGGAFVRVAGRPCFARVANEPDRIRIRLGTLDREVDGESSYADRFEGALGSSDLEYSII
jgi:hypothetical protein